MCNPILLQDGVYLCGWIEVILIEICSCRMKVKTLNHSVLHYLDYLVVYSRSLKVSMLCLGYFSSTYSQKREAIMQL